MNESENSQKNNPVAGSDDPQSAIRNPQSKNPQSAIHNPQSNKMFAEIAIPLNVHQTFTYRLPASFAANAEAGCRVLVPFGKQLLTGYIVDIHETLEETGQQEEDFEIRDVEELFDTEPLVTAELLNLTKWIADYYYAPWGETIKSSLPAGINAEAETIFSITNEGRAAIAAASGKRGQSSKMAGKVAAKMEALARIAENGMLDAGALAREFNKNRASAVARELERSGYITVTRRLQSAQVKPKRQQAVRLIQRAPIEGGKPLNELQDRVIKTLFDSSSPVAFTQLIEMAGVSASVVRTLEKRGYVEVFTREVRRDPLKDYRPLDDGDLRLNQKQQSALDQIVAKLDEGRYAAFLLHGVTGSGKTEIYIRAMRAAVAKGKSALMLVPEISLTPMFARRLRAHFGDAVAIIHSSLSDGERLDEWNRIRQGEARVCIGARSGVFAPMENIGLIVVDEEHEASYKQEETPRYHGRDTAIMRAHLAGAVIIMGSATPSMESFHNAHTG